MYDRRPRYETPEQLQRRLAREMKEREEEERREAEREVRRRAAEAKRRVSGGLGQRAETEGA
jgi:hypothetical protein